MAGFWKEPAARRRLADARETFPQPALCQEKQHPHAPGHHAVHAVVFQPGALEPLDRPRPALGRLGAHGAEWVAKALQPTVALPIVQDRAGDAKASLRK